MMIGLILYSGHMLVHAFDLWGAPLWNRAVYAFISASRTRYSALSGLLYQYPRHAILEHAAMLAVVSGGIILSARQL